MKRQSSFIHHIIKIKDNKAFAVITSFYRGVENCDRHDTAADQDRRVASTRGEADDRDADAMHRADALAPGPFPRCRVVYENAPGHGPDHGLSPDLCLSRGLSPRPDLDLDPALDPGPSRAPTDHDLCTSNRPASSCYLYACDPWFYVWHGRCKW